MLWIEPILNSVTPLNILTSRFGCYSPGRCFHDLRTHDLETGEIRQALRGGGWLILISLVLFTVFGSFFGALGLAGDYWPVLLIVLGLLILVRPLFRSR